MIPKAYLFLSRLVGFGNHPRRGAPDRGGERIRREIEEYKALSDQVMQLTKTISVSVEKVQRWASNEDIHVSA
jgi:hypothetical protein